MNGVLIAFALVLLLPLFIATWRASLLGLSLQGFLMSWIAFHRGVEWSAEAILELVDLVLVRGIGAPVVLWIVMRQQSARPAKDGISSNLLTWGIALALVLIAFRVADKLVPGDGEAQTWVAVSTSGLLLGLLVLATQTGAFSQMEGALRVENAIALFDLSDQPHSPVGVRLAQSLLLVATIALFRWYLVHLRKEADAPSAPEAPPL